MILLKLKIALKLAFASCIAFFVPIYPAMIAIGLLILLDTLTALIAASKTGETITSKKLGAVITKNLVYQMLIISAHLCEAYLFPVVPFVKISLAFLAMTEFTSISENFEKATGKNLLGYVKTFLDEKFRGLIKTDGDKPSDPTVIS